jgi:hypothetical protein
MSASQSQGLGEGWGDFYGLALLSEPGDDLDGVYARGGYLRFMFNGTFTTNYYFGGRRYPYCTDMSKNPLTFKDIDPLQASAHPGIPRSSIVGNIAQEVHNQGEVWCVALWEARANLVRKHGWTVGNELVLQLLTDAMKLSPANPNFIEARDAILEADRVNHQEANYAELWDAFAKRGMGAGATSPDSSTTLGVVEDFSLPIHSVIHVDAAYTGGNSDGSAARPYRTVNQANQVARPLDLILIQGGSYPEAVTFTTRMTVQSENGSATIGRP